MDVFKDPVFGKNCQHTFCRQCLERALETCPSCPTCRATLVSQDIHTNQSFKGLLDELLVRCDAPGCYWTGRQDALPLHVKDCSVRHLNVAKIRIAQLETELINTTAKSSTCEEEYLKLEAQYSALEHLYCTMSIQLRQEKQLTKDERARFEKMLSDKDLENDVLAGALEESEESLKRMSEQCSRQRAQLKKGDANLECSSNDKQLLEQRDSQIEKLYADIDTAFDNGFKKGMASCVSQNKERHWHDKTKGKTTGKPKGKTGKSKGKAKGNPGSAHHI